MSKRSRQAKLSGKKKPTPAPAPAEPPPRAAERRPGHADAATRRGSWVIAGVLFLSAAYFYHAPGWNENSRFNLVRAILDDGTVRIDAYHRNTGDKAYIDGHYYCDKAPGASLAALPGVAAARLALAAASVPPKGRRGLEWALYVATVTTSGVGLAVAGVAVFRAALRLGATPAQAGFAAIAFGLGTPAWVYGALFFGHGLAAASLAAAYALALGLRDAGAAAAVPAAVDRPRRDVLLALGVGLGGGVATLTEYPAFVPAAVLAAFALLSVRPIERPRRGVRVAAGILVGAGACAAVLVAYNLAAFGEPFRIAYEGVQGFPGMKRGLFGVTYPRPDVLREVLFGSFRGLLPLAPIVALAPIGFGLLLARRETRAPAAVALAVALYYILLNASYVYWNGGQCYGPRHAVPALPFLCLPIAAVLARIRWPLRAAPWILAATGAAFSLFAVSTVARPALRFKAPLFDVCWPLFRSGRLISGWNIGEGAGMSGLVSLLPLLLAFVAAGFVWAWLCRSVPGQKSIEYP